MTSCLGRKLSLLCTGSLVLACVAQTPNHIFRMFQKMSQAPHYVSLRSTDFLYLLEHNPHVWTCPRVNITMHTGMNCRGSSGSNIDGV